MLRRLLLLAALVAAVTSCGRFLTAGAAVVEGVSIPQSALEERLQAVSADPNVAAQLSAGGPERVEIERQVLAQLIREELIRQEVERRRIEPSDRAVESRIADIRRSFPSQAEFDRALQRERLTLDELRERVGERLAMEALREHLSGGPLNEQQLRQYYRENRQEFEQVQVKHILFSTREERSEAQALAAARRALAQLREGADFEALARRLSDDPGSRDNGGDLGTIERGTTVEEFERAAFSQPVGVVSEPVRTAFGYHLVLVTEREIKPFDEVEGQIRERLSGGQGDVALNRWLDERLRTASIRVNPRFGDWHPGDGSIRPHEFFRPPATPSPAPGQ